MSNAMESIQNMLSFQNHEQDFGSAIIARIKPISSTTDEDRRGGTSVVEVEVQEGWSMLFVSFRPSFEGLMLLGLLE